MPKWPSEQPPAQWDPEQLRAAVDNFTQGGSRFIKYGALALAGLIALLTGLEQVESQDLGVVTRFGAYSRTIEPGLHLVIPFWVEEVEHVPARLQLKQEFGFRTARADVRTQYRTDDSASAEAVMLTGDLNVANVEWIVQYDIRDPYQYLYRVRNLDETFRDMSETIMRQVVGDQSVTEVLTVGRERIQALAEQALQDLCNHYETGLRVTDVKLQDVNPPGPVRDSFNEVNQATQERERLINQAKATFNQVVPEARGKAQQRLESAHGYATERVNRAKGEVARFVALESEYRKAPEVTRARLYLESVAEVLPRAKRRTLVDPALKNVVPLLNLSSASVGAK